MGILKGICISEKRGTEKHEVREADLKVDWGIEGDAHGGKWHRPGPFPALTVALGRCIIN